MDSDLNAKLQKISNLSIDKLKLSYSKTSIPSHLAPPSSFWDSYTGKKLAFGLHACL